MVKLFPFSLYRYFFTLIGVYFISLSARSQINLAPYELKLESALVFESLEGETQQLKLTLEAREWPLKVLQYVMSRLQKNPYISQEFYVQLFITHPDQSKRIQIEVPVNEFYINAFKTEEGFYAHYIAFLEDTYDWILSRI